MFLNFNILHVYEVVNFSVSANSYNPLELLAKLQVVTGLYHGWYCHPSHQKRIFFTIATVNLENVTAVILRVVIELKSK